MTKLQHAVLKQLGYDGLSDDCETSRECKELLENAYLHGANCGISGFIYYSETVPFFTSNRELIKEQAAEDADSFGTGMLEMIAGFNCLNNDYSVDEVGETLYGSEPDTQIANALAWYALEEVARQLCPNL